MACSVLRFENGGCRARTAYVLDFSGKSKRTAFMHLFFCRHRNMADYKVLYFPLQRLFISCDKIQLQHSHGCFCGNEILYNYLFRSKKYTCFYSGIHESFRSSHNKPVFGERAVRYQAFCFLTESDDHALFCAGNGYFHSGGRICEKVFPVMYPRKWFFVCAAEDI
ncbi:hypothetical protein SDC9_93831 [bioreactor metagenome]|uniref:Uncharacterized protein n=1 Tax=bioreactor metagenome TaxID=1076179 RepID=A0A645A8D6_9ZZZZ